MTLREIRQAGGSYLDHEFLHLFQMPFWHSLKPAPGTLFTVAEWAPLKSGRDASYVGDTFVCHSITTSAETIIVHGERIARMGHRLTHTDHYQFDLRRFRLKKAAPPEQRDPLQGFLDTQAVRLKNAEHDNRRLKAENAVLRGQLDILCDALAERLAHFLNGTSLVRGFAVQRVGGGKATVIHPDFSSAKVECERLAKANTGARFHVVPVVGDESVWAAVFSSGVGV